MDKWLRDAGISREINTMTGNPVLDETASALRHAMLVKMFVGDRRDDIEFDSLYDAKEAVKAVLADKSPHLEQTRHLVNWYGQQEAIAEAYKAPYDEWLELKAPVQGLHEAYIKARIGMFEALSRVLTSEDMVFEFGKRLADLSGGVGVLLSEDQIGFLRSIAEDPENSFLAKYAKHSDDVSKEREMKADVAIAADLIAEMITAADAKAMIEVDMAPKLAALDKKVGKKDWQGRYQRAVEAVEGVNMVRVAGIQVRLAGEKVEAWRERVAASPVEAWLQAHAIAAPDSDDISLSMRKAWGMEAQNLARKIVGNAKILARLEHTDANMLVKIISDSRGELLNKNKNTAFVPTMTKK